MLLNPGMSAGSGLRVFEREKARFAGPAALGTRSAKIRKRFEWVGVEAFTYMDYVGIAFLDLTVRLLRRSPCSRKIAETYMWVAVHNAETVALPPTGHDSKPAETAYLRLVGVNVAPREEAVIVDVPIGSDANVEVHALKVINDKRLGGVRGLASADCHGSRTSSWQCLWPRRLWRLQLLTLRGGAAWQRRTTVSCGCFSAF